MDFYNFGRVPAMVPAMTDEEKAAQRESFAYGNLKLDGVPVTREQVHQIAVGLGRETADVVPVERRAPALHSAYLVAVFQLAGEPKIPIFIGVGIFSEPEPSVGGDRRCWTVFQIDDISYAEAKRHLLIAVCSTPHLVWAVPHLKERDLL